MSKCAVANCGVTGDDVAIVYGYSPDPGGPLVSLSGENICFDCFAKAQRVDNDLPLAIMEFHAFALMHSERKNLPVYVTAEQSAAMDAAEKRVIKLRAIEAWLKGEDNP